MKANTPPIAAKTVLTLESTEPPSCCCAGCAGGWGGGDGEGGVAGTMRGGGDGTGGDGGGVVGGGGGVGGGGDGEGGGDGGGIGVGSIENTEEPTAVLYALQPFRPPRWQWLSMARYATKLHGSCWSRGRRTREQPGGSASLAQRLKQCSRDTRAKPLQLTCRAQSMSYPTRFMPGGGDGGGGGCFGIGPDGGGGRGGEGGGEGGGGCPMPMTIRGGGGDGSDDMSCAS